MQDIRDFFKHVSSYIGVDLPCEADPDLFFSTKVEDTDKARELCASCPMLAHCLTGATDRREPTGVWGGEWFESGTPVIRRRPGRPTGSRNKVKIGQLTLDGDLVPLQPTRLKIIAYPDLRQPPRMDRPLSKAAQAEMIPLF